VLRVILELDYVEMTIIGAHHVRLRSTAHSSYMLHSFYRHGGILALGVNRSSFSPLWG
jgi:hypothetical protein